uniref:Biogenesis of lysosome-related organelles complex 1 subunit BLS1 n=1 Tax=Strongyloides papillosus TaxID=174720 RepID=A0A0N5B3N3_STREA
MAGIANEGIVLNLNDNEAEQLIKLLIHHPKLNDFAPREKIPNDVDGRSEVLNKISKLEDNIMSTCKITRSFIKQVERNFRYISEMIDAERRSMENSFSLLNERLSNIERVVMNRIMELDGVVRSASSNNNRKDDDNPDNSTSDSNNNENNSV